MKRWNKFWREEFTETFLSTFLQLFILHFFFSQRKRRKKKKMSLDESFIVERIADPNNEVFESYVLKNKPFVITEVVTKWPAFRSWKDPDYLLEKVFILILVESHSKSSNFHLINKFIFSFFSLFTLRKDRFRNSDSHSNQLRQGSHDPSSKS